MRKSLFTFGSLCLALGIIAFWFASNAWLKHPSADAEGMEVRIVEGWSTTQIAYMLETKGAIDSALGYRIFSYLDEAGRQGKPGNYVLKRGTSYRDIALILSKGQPRAEAKIRVLEGWSTGDISQELRKNGVMSDIDFAAAPRSGEYAFLRALPKGASLEGFLFPDTYRVYADQLPEALIEKQLNAFAALEPRISAEAKKQGRTLLDVVTLASIVEKEVGGMADRKLVAGIFWNRLRIGMPLQSDATVNFVTKGGRARPTYDDLAVDSPYNTYKVKGLPPGPISMPGKDALEAALFPAKTPYFYFLTDTEGKTYFAKTFEEHIANRNKAF